MLANERVILNPVLIFYRTLKAVDRITYKIICLVFHNMVFDHPWHEIILHMCPLLLPLPTHSQGWRRGLLADRVLQYSILCPCQCKGWKMGLGLRSQKDKKFTLFYYPTYHTSPVLFVSYNPLNKSIILANMRPWTGECEGWVFS
jgi:hypothetical protein